MRDWINKIARRSPIWALYMVALLWAGYLFALGILGHLGPEPVKALEHRYGVLGLQSLIAVMAISPLRRFFGVNLLRFRRAVALIATMFITLHLLVWAILDVQIMAQVWGDILKRPYITIGMAAFVLMVPLALTSNNAAIRRLGARWRRLHQLTYVIVPLGALHYVMLVKGFQIQPLIYLALALGLVLLRVPVKRRWKLA